MTASIKSIADKFNGLKDTLESGDKKMKQHQQDVETGKMEIQLLETELENLQSIDAKKESVRKDKEQEIAALQK